MYKRFCILFLILAVFFSGNVPTVGDKIIEFSMQHLKKKVDTGECWDLANAALNYANAKWTAPFGFGTKINTSQIKRADIIQFTNIKIKFTNGSISFPKHTAIIYKANKDRVTLIHQNFNNKRYVDTISLNLSDVKSGTVDAYRPVGN